MYSCQSGTPIVKEIDVTTKILSKKTFKSVGFVNGRAFTRTADEGVKLMWKVWAFAKQQKPTISGDSSIKDVLNRVLGDMWKDLKGRNGDGEDIKMEHKRKFCKMSADVSSIWVGRRRNCDSDKELKPPAYENVSTRQREWMFNGFISFAVFAPF